MSDSKYLYAHTDIDDDEINVTALTVEQTVTRIHACAQNKQDFDIYQLCAFLAQNPKQGNYRLAKMKAIVCLLSQLPALIFILLGVSSQGLEEYKGSWCPGGGDVHLKYFCFCFSVHGTSLPANLEYLSEDHSWRHVLCLHG